MSELSIFSLDEISQRLKSNSLPLSGITESGSAEFHILEPSHYIGVSLHAGHRVRREIFDLMVVSEEDRSREEDTFTELFINDFPIRIISLDSRFEYDLNREPERSIYSSERGIWELDIWRCKVEGQLRDDTLVKHKEFHDLVDVVVEYLLMQFDRLLVYDMHSYCYQREKKQQWYEDPRPEINLGTKSINRNFFSPMIEQFLHGVSGMIMDGHSLRVSENEAFPGGYLTRKYARTHNQEVLVLAIEYKKIFMNEWTGELYPSKLKILVDNLMLTKDRILRTKV